MKAAETVTFGGSGLDRAAELRGQDELVEWIATQGNGQSILLWRGKPLVCTDALDTLVQLPLDHPLLTARSNAAIFLGRDENDTLLFAHDLSDWQPADLDAETLDAFLDKSEQAHPDIKGAVFAELRRIMTRLSPRDAELAATAKSVLGWHISHRFCARCGHESALAQNGWQRSCPACHAQHFPRTDPVVIMLITQGTSVLMGRSHGWPEGMYSLLAGFVEPGETIEAAVRREVMEEAGIRVGQVAYLSSQPWAFPSSLMFGCSGTALSTDITIDPSEIEDARWFSAGDVLSAFAGQHPTLAPARKGAIAHFLLRNWLADTLD